MGSGEGSGESKEQKEMWQNNDRLHLWRETERDAKSKQGLMSVQVYVVNLRHACCTIPGVLMRVVRGRQPAVLLVCCLLVVDSVYSDWNLDWVGSQWLYPVGEIEKSC